MTARHEKMANIFVDGGEFEPLKGNFFLFLLNNPSIYLTGQSFKSEYMCC